MRPTLREVFDRLVAENLLAPEDERRILEALVRQGNATPWFVKALVGVGAWVATALFLVFVVLLDLFNEPSALVVLGLGLVGAGVFLRRLGSAAIGVQLALAVSLVGQTMAVFGLVEATHLAISGGVLLLLLSGALLVFFPDPVHRFLSTLGAVASVLYLLFELHEEVGPDVGFAVLAALTVVHWLRPPRLVGLAADLSGPVGHGLSVALLLLIAPDSFGARELGHAVVGTAVLTVALLGVEVSLLRQLRGRLDGVAFGVLGVTLAVGVLTWSVPGLWAALVVTLLGVHRREPLLCGQGLAAFVIFLGRYYYSLEVTLLQKSAALVLTGAVLLGVWRFLQPSPPRPSARPSAEVSP